MRTKLFLAIMLCAGIAVRHPFSAQADIIIMKDGTSITVYNIEKGEGSVFYNLTSDDDAPLKKLSLSDIFAIKIGDGEMQVIESKTNVTETTHPSTVNDFEQEATPAPNNQSLINQYNEEVYTFKAKEKNKTAQAAIAIWGVTPTSVLSTEEIEIRFESGLWYENKWLSLTELAKKKNMSMVNNLQNRIFIYNKTNSNLYIDLSRTIRNSNCIGYRQFYDGSVVSHGSSSSSAVGVGVGIIGIGTSSGSSTTLSEVQPSTLVIFPDSEVELPRESYVSDYDKKIYERYEKFSHTKGAASFASKIGTLNQYKSVFYDDTNSPEKIGYSLIFSRNQDFTSCKRLNFSFYIRQLIGLPKLWNTWSGSFEDDLQKISPLTNRSILSSFKLAD